jgi:cytochrome c oxidase subunit I
LTPPPATEAPREEDLRAHAARDWLALAVGALAVSGFLALWVVAGRIPALAPHWADAELANRLLVVHVDLGVVVWFGALPVALFHLHAMATGSLTSSWRVRVAPWIAGAGALFLLLGLVPGLGTPRPVNYIPVVSHPAYALGLLLFFAGVGVSYLEGHLVGWEGASAGHPLPSSETGGVAVAGGSFLPDHVSRTLAACGPLVRVGALYFLAALVALGAALLRLPPWLDGDARMEVLMWGGGHILQFTNVAFALVAWALLASWWSGRALVGKRAIRWSALALSVSLVPIVFLLALEPASAQYRAGFTSLMRWGLFPSVLVFLALALLPHWWLGRDGGPGSVSCVDPEHEVGGAAEAVVVGRTGTASGAGLALAASIVLMLAGFLFGAFIRGADLRIPGHYHACIGAVTLAYMALTLLISAGGRPARSSSAGSVARSWRRPSPLVAVAALYGVGQLVFSTGLFVAGSYGLGRKLYGMEQELLNAGQGVGLGIMAVGGTLALAGGVTWALAALRRSGALFHTERTAAREGYGVSQG